MSALKRNPVSNSLHPKHYRLKAAFLTAATLLSVITSGVLVDAHAASMTSSALAITSPATLDVVTGVHASFTVTTNGSPTPVISESGALPTGLVFTDNEDGSATIAGTPASTDAGTYNVTITASNGVNPNATQSLRISLSAAAAPKFTSADVLDLQAGIYKSFTVTTSGSPTPTLSENGGLPAGMSITARSDGTATIAGTPALNSIGSYVAALTASNVFGGVQQSLAMTVSSAAEAKFTSADSLTVRTGVSTRFTLTTNGSPTPVLSETGRLPAGVTLTINDNGTATIVGTPAPNSIGSYVLDLTATNGYLTPAHQTFTLTVVHAVQVSFTSSATVTFRVGATATFTVAATGSPSPVLTETGRLPAGLTFSAHNNGTATIYGTPAFGSTGVYLIHITATNDTSGSAQQSLQVDVAEGGVSGYWYAISNGQVLQRGVAPLIASASQHPRGIVAMTSMKDGKGYYLVSSFGGVFNYGDAHFYGSIARFHLRSRTVAFALTPDDRGYWLVTTRGNIFSYGDARFYGSPVSRRIPPVTAFSATPDGRGYWVVTSGGNIFNYGDAAFYGSLVGRHLPAITAFAVTPNDGGYWAVTSRGYVFNFGNASNYGSPASRRIPPVAAFATTPDGRGYWVVTEHGNIFNYGDAAFFGSSAGQARNVVGFAVNG